eukprot:PITA_11565
MVLVQDDDDGTEHVIYYLSRNLFDTESRYAYVEKLALIVVCAIQRFRHYILLRTMILISDCNPMAYILSRQLLGGKYSKWIVTLQKFDLEFTAAKSKKSLVFDKLLCSLPSTATSSQLEDSIPDETLFLISTLDPWYGDIIVYLQASSFHPETSKDARRWIGNQAQPYRIVGDTLYRLGVDSVLRRCLTFEEAERVLNDCHSGACGGHMSGYATTQKILRAGYFWPSIFKDCILFVHSCHEWQIYQQKMCAPPAPLHPVVTVDPFAKWGIDYVTCNPRSAGGMGTSSLLSIISRNGPRKHFRNDMMTDLTTQLGLRNDSSTPYYPQANSQVEVVNKIPSLKIAVELLPNTTPVEERLLYLERLDETRRLASLAIEAQKKRVKTHFDNIVNPRSFIEGDLVLLYDQANDKLGAGKLEPMWHGPYIVKSVLQKGAYELIDYEGNPLDRPRNGLYLKKYYA